MSRARPGSALAARWLSMLSKQGTEVHPVGPLGDFPHQGEPSPRCVRVGFQEEVEVLGVS